MNNLDEDIAYIKNSTCDVSDLFYQRARDTGLQIPKTDNLNSIVDRNKFSTMLVAGGEQLCQKLGIPYVETTKEVHDVTSGGMPSGDLYFCDLLKNLYPFEDGARVLDFGCSTGRVIRNLKAAFPKISAYGCDPRSSSIEFIEPLVPDVNWFRNNETPPLSDQSLRFDMVFAISVWSHFSEERALEWFNEMARIIETGGKLIFSTHGERSVYHFLNVKKNMHGKMAAQRMEFMKEGKFHFLRYGVGSDLDEHWGVAFMPKSWPAQNLSDDWAVSGFYPGLAMANQDVFVLERV